MQSGLLELEQSVSGKLRTVRFKSGNCVIEAEVVRLFPQAAIIQLYSLENELRLSDVLTDFEVLAEKFPAYHGKAVVRSLVDTGTVTICEVDLGEPLTTFDSLQVEGVRHSTQVSLNSFLERWQQFYCIEPAYKLAVANLASYLSEFRVWLDQVELGLSNVPPEHRLAVEREIASELDAPTAASVGALFEEYERVASRLPENSTDAHRVYCRRLIQPLVLSSPFALRAVRKPLGYAGDYLLVDMIIRDPHEGKSLYGKVLNRWFIKQPPAEAHRNRIKHLTQKLVEETARVRASGRIAKVFNIGCGPAQEIQRFYADSALSDHVEFMLLDFNDETLNVARKILEQGRDRHGRRAKMEFLKKSAAQLLRMKETKAGVSIFNQYDFVYCAGLYDYLSDSLCRQLNETFYKMLRPGGLLVVTNVDSSNPIRHWLGDILEWHLIYRGYHEMMALRPNSINPDCVRVVADVTSVNIFMEIRKPS